MSKFSNSTKVRARSLQKPVATPAPLVRNAAGGLAFAQSDKMHLISLVLSNMLSGDMYRSESQVLSQLQALVKKLDPEFVAKTALYARNEFGMRSTSQALAGELASTNATSGKEWSREFYNAIVRRVDDMMEIMGYYFDKNPQKPLPNALKAGFAEAFNRFDSYQLARYKGENRAVKLVDVVRLVRPKPVVKNADALAKLLKGDLKNTQTWEAKMSSAGQVCAEEKEEARSEVWSDLLSKKSLGYLALIRNLANIAIDANDTTFDLAISALTDAQAIKKSLIFPFQLYVAYKEVEKNLKRAEVSRIAKIMDALSQALDISCANVPEMPGKTLVAIDISGSMSTSASTFSAAQVCTLATLFGVVLAKANDADVIQFESSAKFVPVLKSRSTLDSVKLLDHTTGGTNFESIFDLIIKERKRYDRIFILSDMMAWIQTNWSPKTMLEKYKAIMSTDPFIYSFDLKGQGTTQFDTGGKVVQVAGYSEKIFDIIKLAETDKEALLKTIESYPIQVTRGFKRD